MMASIKIILLLAFIPFAVVSAQPEPQDNLQFNHLATRWDEAMPLGNGMLGALVWQKDSMLRISLDRADLWDERTALDLSKFNFQFVVQHVLSDNYDTVHKLGDEPYDQIVYPTKLPAAAIEFDTRSFGNVLSNVLDIKTALNTVQFQSGIVFHCFVHASKNQGYFSFENLSSLTEKNATGIISPQLVIPGYNGNQQAENDNSHAGEGLEKLGYKKGTITSSENTIRYHQPTYNEHYYEVFIEWKIFPDNKIIGTWTISNDTPAVLAPLKTYETEPTGWIEHIGWWKNFWSQSSIEIPDTLLEKQYLHDMYKFGCVARVGAPAITLQSVWTADNGSLPPWKGDFHNDLNTQLSYWPSYTSNHLTAASTYTDWLWKTKSNNLKFTKQYFGVEGLNVPGVETISGNPMGGWIQYSLSPTTVAWCAQHFFWQWKYSMNDTFLKNRVYPYLHDAATYLENITFIKNGVRKLPLSSSPEYNDNNINAWFLNWTNYDLSLAKFLFSATAEISDSVHKPDEAKHWNKILSQLPGYNINETGLTIAPGQNLDESHRHMSPYMAIFPLALLDVNNPGDKIIIENSLKHIESKGTRNWCGYSFAWMASLYARAYKADSAVNQLKIFASNFCSPNSFHLNGDQKGGEYSNFTYRPFTLEGNFAFAEGVQELLLQSRNNYIEIFPAIPKTWENVSFTNLRAEGAFIISAKKETSSFKINIKSETGGICKLKLPFSRFSFSNPGKKYVVKDGLLIFTMIKNEKIEIRN